MLSKSAWKCPTGLCTNDIPLPWHQRARTLRCKHARSFSHNDLSWRSRVRQTIHTQTTNALINRSTQSSKNHYPLKSLRKRDKHSPHHTFLRSGRALDIACACLHFIGSQWSHDLIIFTDRHAMLSHTGCCLRPAAIRRSVPYICQPIW